MEKTRSNDGTVIAFDLYGEGPPVILVGWATCDRVMTRPLAEELAKRCAVINPDRRGRGDTAPYAVEREIEDLEALIVEAGGDGVGVRPFLRRRLRLTRCGTRSAHDQGRSSRAALRARR